MASIGKKKTSNGANLKQGSLFSFFSKKPKAAPAPDAPAAEPVSTPSPVSQSKSNDMQDTKLPLSKSGPPNTSESSSSIGTTQSSVSPSPSRAKTTTTTTSSTSQKNNNNKNNKNTQWKKLGLGDTIRIWWPDDRQYYAAVITQMPKPSNTSVTSSKFHVRYDDGESEWIDLSMERFQFLSKASTRNNNKKAEDNDDRIAATASKRRRHINDDDDDSDEYEWQEEQDEDDDDDESVFEGNDDASDDDEDEELNVDQGMVTDDEEDKQIAKQPAKKRAKTNNRTASTFSVIHHNSSGSRKSGLDTSTPTKHSKHIAPPAAQKTLLNQFANTITPLTNSPSLSGSSSSNTNTKNIPATSSQQTTIQSSKTTSNTTSHSSAAKQSHTSAIPYIKGAVNVKGAHVHNHLSFLQNPRDINGHRPGDPLYNPRTLRVVPDEWNKHMGKMTDAVQQWWDLKAQYFDTVLLFKTGKFYEMFHMDADIGVEVLQLSYMKGHTAHAGFPEISYGPMADKLVRAGYKVARVEQTETPEQLKDRKTKTKPGKKKPAVVNREVCSIVSLGTRTFCSLDDEGALEQIDNMTSSQGSNGGVGPLLAISQVIIDPMDTDEDENTEQDNAHVKPVCEYGVTIVDAVRSTVTVGQFADDILMSRMNTLLARFAPSEILLAPDASPTLKAMIKSYQSNTRTNCRLEFVQLEEHFPKSTALDPTHRHQMERKSTAVHPWDVDETLEELHRRRYYPRSSKQQVSGDNGTNSIRRWPPVLKALVDGQANLCLASFGAALYYLQRHLIDHEILSMGIVKAYIPESSTSLSQTTTGSNPSLQQALEQSSQGDEQDLETNPLTGLPQFLTEEDKISYMSLDGTTLHNLEILTNSVDNKVAGSLWSKINYCKSPHGARFLRAWLLRPLFRKADIDRRADAVQDLATGAGAVALNEARQHVLGKLGDLDRLLSRIHSMSGTPVATSDHDAQDDDSNFHPNERAVLYESATYTKRKVNDFSKALHGLRRACQIPELFADLHLNENGLLYKLVRLQGEGGCFPNMVEELDWFIENFDCSKAAKGMFEPMRGVDEAYDAACDTVQQIQGELEDYRVEMCNQLKPRHVALSKWKYINTKPENKDKYLIELPASVEVPADFLVKGKRGSGDKQVNKYRSSVVARLVNELEQALEVQQVRKAKGMQLIFSKFDSKSTLWRAAAQATAMLDALGSLAKVAAKPGFCRPTILECSADEEPVLSIVQGRHPCVETSTIHTTDFIPNDLELGVNRDGGGDSARLLLLSGPNMGGKSTLLRQTCLISILAQLGSYVPAETCSLTPIDCIYTRLGASDRILLGQSTFFVELAETAAALRGATRRSLVIMDELGRGTSTFDGTAIAGATVKHLIERSRCLTLFATHYHSLLDEWKDEQKVRLGHMQCLVENSMEDEDAGHSITFLYTLGPGTCPKSFGINVAQLASLPAEVLRNAKRVSEEFEEEMADANTSGDSKKDEITAAIKSGNWEDLRRLWSELNN